MLAKTPVFTSTSSLLNRPTDVFAPQFSRLNPIQVQVDGMVGAFLQEATDVRALASIAAGSLAYRFTRIGIMGVGAGNGSLRVFSMVAGLSSEVVAFEGTHRSLSAMIGDRSNPNLWHWNGPGGLGQGLASSLITFGMLKSAGHLSRETNVIFRHAFSSSATVAGHQTAAAFGIIPRPEGSLAEQFLHAEMTNLQLGAGGVLMHQAAPGIHGLERGVDLSLHAADHPTMEPPMSEGRTGWRVFQGIEPGLAKATPISSGEGRGFSLTGSPISQMSRPRAQGGGRSGGPRRGGSTGDPVAQLFQEFRDKIFVNFEEEKAQEHLTQRLSDLNSSQQLDLGQRMFTLLGNPRIDDSAVLIQSLQEIATRLSQPERLAFISRVEPLLNHRKANLRFYGLWVLTDVAKLMESSDLMPWVPKVEKMLEDRDESVPDEAMFALGAMIPRLGAVDRLPRVLKVIEQAHRIEDEENLHHMVVNSLAHLRAEDFPALAMHVARYSEHLRYPSDLFFEHILPQLDSKERLPVALEFVGRNDEDFIEGILREMNGAGRMEFLRQMVGRVENLADVSLTLVSIALRRIPSETFLKFAQTQNDSKLLLLARFHGSRLPLDPYFWRLYLKAADPGTFAEEMLRQISAYRRGQNLTTGNERDLRLAYAGLDLPSKTSFYDEFEGESLSYEEFAAGIQKKAPPPLFLNRPFEMTVREVRSLHVVFDHGKLNQAWDPIKNVSDGENFHQFLSRLLDREPGAFRPIRSELERVFPEKAVEIYSFELPERAKELLPRLKGLKLGPPLQELALHLMISAGLEAAPETLVSRMRGGMGHSVSSAELLDSLKATEEFYRDTLGDILRREGFNENAIPFIRHQRRLLLAELKKIETLKGSPVPVEFIPSRNQADPFFAYVSEDCNEEGFDAIYRDDFQLYRMVANERLTGLVYLQRAILAGNRVLVIAPQPRSFWQVDYPDLLRVMEDNFGRLAAEEGYDYVLLMQKPHKQGNRVDMLQAIRDRQYEPIHFKDLLVGAVFTGRNFLVVWKKEGGTSQ